MLFWKIWRMNDIKKVNTPCPWPCRYFFTGTPEWTLHLQLSLLDRTRGSVLIHFALHVPSLCCMLKPLLNQVMFLLQSFSVWLKFNAMHLVIWWISKLEPITECTLCSYCVITCKKKKVSEYTWEAYLHEYGHYDQSIRAFSSFCIICVQLMIVVYQLNLEHKERT